ncbi:sigma-70 family RNA polymerase sigma factor [Candidatus Pacearchaeota archaeon]|nr:sigma-70 family RNA polymerase sigma factor [Candidatus Pacearchaeota archaeon]
MKLSLLSDSELIKRYRRTGDCNCIEELYKRYKKQHYNYLLFTLKDETAAEDILSDAWGKILRYLAREDYPIKNFMSWSFSVIRTKAIDFFSRPQYESLDNPKFQFLPSKQHSPAKEVENCERNTSINEAVSQLLERLHLPYSSPSFQRIHPNHQKILLP